MLVQIHYPQHLTSQELDGYLEQGWFRMGQSIFTTNFLNFKDQLYSAVWLRVLLDDYVDDNLYLKLVKQNAAFRIEIGRASVTEEKEALYATYKQSVPFNASASLHQLLYGKSAMPDIYNTHEIKLYDDNKLIAIGYFDIGKRSAAGISSFYDPAYKKYSLGKYLIYSKMEYCRKMKLQYFYPGYFAPGYPAFDYKLSMGKKALQYFQLKSGQWLTINKFSQDEVPLQMMKTRLMSLQALLAAHNLNFKFYKYEFFDANLIPDLKGVDVFDFPVFLHSTDDMENLIGPIIIFDVRDQQYHVIRCYSLWRSDLTPAYADVYVNHLLKIHQFIFSTESQQDIVMMIDNELGRGISTQNTAS
ncbi:MAG TPA: GNAT family N-acetyltransferase [Cyclobacteriaceae bacterium]